jgi:hypothetical protein
MKKKTLCSILIFLFGSNAWALEDFKCGTYQITGILKRPDPGSYEIAIYPGSKGEFSLELFDLDVKQALPRVDRRVTVTGRVESPGQDTYLVDVRFSGKGPSRGSKENPVRLIQEQKCK